MNSQLELPQNSTARLFPQILELTKGTLTTETNTSPRRTFNTMTEVNGAASESDPAPTQEQNDQPSQAATEPINPNIPSTSQLDNGLSKRPRDARLFHIILANYGVTAYQERVPLQLMDFAYRYTSSTLQDALHFTSEGYGTTNPTGPGAGTKRGEGAAAHNDMSGITLSSLRLSIASRTQYQFSPTLPKEFYSELAQERNRVGIPPPPKGEYGVRLPPEQYCLFGAGWELKEEWDEEMDVEQDAGAKDEGMDEREDGEGGGDEEEGGRMEDIFGGANGDEDKEMEDE